LVESISVFNLILLFNLNLIQVSGLIGHTCFNNVANCSKSFKQNSFIHIPSGFLNEFCLNEH
jgi:hypothetical protein